MVTKTFRRCGARRCSNRKMPCHVPSCIFPSTIGIVSLVRVKTMRICDGMSSLPSEPCVKIIGIFWHETVEEFLEVAPRGWIGIFHNNHAATGVLNKDRDRPAAQTAFVDLALNFIRNFVRAFAICLDREIARLNVHRSNPQRYGFASGG